MKLAAFATLVVVLLSGCASQRNDPPGGLKATTEQLQQIAGFELNGRVGVRTASDGFNGSLTWRQEYQQLALSMHGPLGIGRVEIEGDESGVIVTSAKIGEQRFDSPEQALEQLFAWSLPVASLRYWALGAPDPNMAVADLGYYADTAGGGLAYLSQNDWRIEYSEYRQAQGWWLPAKMVLQGGPLQVKLVIKDWQILAPGAVL